MIRPKVVQNLVEQSVRRMIDLLDLGIEEHDEADDYGRWTVFEWEKKKSDER
jgi:phenylacrylic acid decarboxylase